MQAGPEVIPGPACFILQIRHNAADLYLGHGRCLA